MLKRYKTEPLKLWNKVKEIRQTYYRNYAQAHEKGGLRWAGGAWTFDAVCAGLGDDVYSLTSEPYGASIAFDREFSAECMKVAEKAGYPRDLCSYMRNYWGSVILDKYAFGGPFPRPDFIWQDHMCCSHAKWYQVVSELKGGIPMYCVDVAVGPCDPWGELTKEKIDYVAGQILDGIDWLEKVTGRTFNDEKFIEACWNDFRTTSKWAEICNLQQAVPAPLEEKTIFSLYVLATLQKSWKVVANFYDELCDEVQDRVERGIAAVESEQARVMSDTQPPWGFLNIFRYLEKYGVVCVGSLYSFGLMGMWTYNTDGGMLVPKSMPEKKPISREEATRELVKWHLHKPEYQHFYSPQYKSDMMIALARDWKLDGVMLHYNRGCEGLSLGIAENRLALLKAGLRVLTYEGNMGDEREFDEVRTRNQIDAFMETLGIRAT